MAIATAGMDDGSESSKRKSMPFFPALYEDAESLRLTGWYDLSSVPASPLGNSLNSVEQAYTAFCLLNLSRIRMHIVGVHQEYLSAFLNAGYGVDSEAAEPITNNMQAQGYLRAASLGEILALFPTEALLREQGVRKK